MPGQQTIRIFISSPADVRPERLKAEQIIARLDREFAYHFRVEAVLWEREPLVAAHHFQDERNLTPPRSTDVVVVILWSRLGINLPEDQFQGAVSGRRPVTGTEWEFEDALAAARSNGVPDLLLYQKTARRVADLDDDRVINEAREQRDRVEDFMGRWFRSADGKELTAAWHSFASTVEFEERLYENLHSLLARRAGSAADGVTIRWHEAPFRGLLSFEFEHAPVFFGRTRARNEIREVLARQEARGCAFVLVMGASGSGKSSLVKAGLLPDLMLPGMIGRVALVRYLQVRPSDASTRPLDGLAAALMSSTALPELAGLRYTAEHLAALLNEVPRQVALPIEQGLAEAGKQAGLTNLGESRLAVLVDQLEEIFTFEVTDEARSRFISALDALARCGLVWVLATMRSDFYDRIETLPALAALATEGATYRLSSPDDAELGQIIRQPAYEAGLRFETDARRGISLDEVIRQDAAADRGALPLLSFLLDQLWQRQSPRGELTFAAYNDLGGFQGALGRRAAEIFDGLPNDVQTSLPRVLRALVTIGQGAQAVVAARPTALSRFPEGSPERRLIDAFVAPDARLLVAAEGDAQGSGPRIRVAHEALLTHWDRARDWIAERPADLQLEERIEAEAERWAATTEADKPSLLLRAGLPLTEAEALLNRRGDELAQVAIGFIEASIAAERERLAGIREQQEQRVRDAQAIAAANRRIAHRTMIGLAIAVVFALVGIGLWLYAEGQRHEADVQRQLAETQRQEAEKEKTLAQKALAAGISTTRAMVEQLAVRFRGERGIRLDLIKDILGRAKSLLDQLEGLGEQTIGSRTARVQMLGELSDTYLSQGDIADAESLATQARDLADALVKETPQNAGVFNAAANAYAQLASVRFRQGQWDESIQLRQSSADDDRKCFDLDKNTTACLDNGIIQLGGLGDVYFERQRLDDALGTYRKALGEVDDLDRFEKQRRDRIPYHRASIHRMIGDVLVEKSDFQGALAEYEIARSITEPIAMKAKATASQQEQLASLYVAISATYTQIHDFDRALEADGKARQLLEPLVASDPQNLVWRGGLQVVYQHLAVNLVNAGRRNEAIPFVRQFAAQAEAIYKIDPNSPSSQQGEAEALMRLVEIGDQPRSRLHDAYTMLRQLSRSGRMTSEGNIILDRIRRACGVACLE
jgi:tetratricopeptide (TPR) repeat protein